MVTAYPLPEGFTELEVFAIGTALLVEGKLGLGPQLTKKDFCLYYCWCGSSGGEIEASSSISGMLTQTFGGYCGYSISSSGGLQAVGSEDLLRIQSCPVAGKDLLLSFLIKNLGCENLLMTFKGNFSFPREGC